MNNESGELKTVLHVLPHPGGGGETYVDALSRMHGYRFERIVLSPSPMPSATRIRALPLNRRAASFVRANLLHVHGEIAAGICLPALAARRSARDAARPQPRARRPPVQARPLRGSIFARLCARFDRTICCAESSETMS